MAIISSRNQARIAGMLVASFVLSSVIGCNTAPKPSPPANHNVKHKNTPSAAALIAMHNKNVAPIKQLWARSVVEIEYLDEKGKQKHVQGEGHLITKLPHNTALTIGKIGQVSLWAGSNTDYYWLFDKINNDVLYLGVRDDSINQKKRLANIPANARRLTQLPLPVKPTQLAHLFGIVKINTQAIQSAIVTTQNKHHILTLPKTRIRYTFAPANYLGDNKNYLPVRIELLDEKNQPAILAILSTPQRMAMDDILLGPVINTRNEITFPKRKTRLTLHLNGLTGEAAKAKDKLFDLDFLKRINKPKQIIYITP